MAVDAPPLTIRLNAADNVVIAHCPLIPGTAIASEGVTVKAAIPAGHKLATRAVGGHTH